MARMRLGFAHDVEVGGARIRTTDVFGMGDGRVAALAEVARDGKTSVQLYYRSNSQGVFRLLPALNLSQRRWGGAFDGLPVFDKGDGEEHLTAPIVVEDLLQGLRPRRARLADVDALLHAAVPIYRSPAGYARYLAGPAKPTSQKIRLFDRVGGEPVIRAPLRPDYRHPLSRGVAHSKLDGDVEQLRYPSRDGRLVYTLHVDRAGRAQIATVTAVDAQVNELGLPTRTVTSDAVTTPQWEYTFQIPDGMAGALHPRDRNYASSWRYLRERPEIRAFYRATGRPRPDA